MSRRTLRLREPSEQALQRAATAAALMLISVWLLLVITIPLLALPGLDASLWYYHASTLGLGVVATVMAWVALWAQTPVLAENDAAAYEAGTDDVARLRLALNADVGVARNAPLAKAAITTVIVLTLLEIPLMSMVPTILSGHNDVVANMSNVWAVLLSVAGTVLVCAFYTEAWQWTYVAAATALRLPWAFQAIGHDPIAMRHTTAMGLIAMSFVIAELFYLRAVARAGDAALSDSTEAVISTAAKASATNEAARIDGLVHDHILAALLLASRADDPEDAPFIRRSAAGALAALSDISAPEGAETEDGKTTVTTFATRLVHDVHTENPTIHVTGRGSRTEPIPADAAAALHAAAMEAVRNSLRHADGGSGRAINRQVAVHTTPDAVSVIVADDGVGFDQAKATKGRYGVVGSILGRLESVEGASARIDSTRGEGTRVTLTWTDPDALVTGRKKQVEDAIETSPLSPENAELKYFAQLADTPTEEIPVAPTIRSAVVLLLGFLYLIVDTLEFFNPVWVSPVSAVVFFAAFVLSVLPWLDDPLKDPGKGAVALMVGIAPLTLAATLWAWDSPRHMELHLWTLMFIYVASVLLAFGNYARAALALGGLSAVVLVVWSLITSGGANLPFEVVALLVLMPWAANRMQRKAFASLAESANLAAKHRREADGRARDLSAVQARRRRGARVDTLARPLLERLAAGERTVATVRVEAAQLEAHLRDDLRARCFRDTDVTRAANDARRAGVRVDLMDDGGLTNASAELRQEVIGAAIEALDGADSGSVIVRVAPPGRDVVATILTETEVGAGAKTQRLEIHAQPVGSLVGANNDK